MTGAERCLLLLCCPLGDPEAHPLTAAQFRDLGQRIQLRTGREDPQGQVTARILADVGCDAALTARILALLNREPRLAQYLQKAEALSILPLTRLSPDYPAALAAKLRFDAPRAFFCRGDLSLLHRPAIAVVGSRQLWPENEAFARLVGQLAAAEGMTLVTGGAVGADTAALEACLSAGGTAVVYVPDALTAHSRRDRCLFISDGGYDLPFSTVRALGRNHLIHAHAAKTLAVQCSFGVGGTWQGCVENLRRRLSELYVFNDGSQGAAALVARGAVPVSALSSLRALKPLQSSLF